MTYFSGLDRPLTLEEAERALSEYAVAVMQRDLVILAALEARVPKARIAALSGHGRPLIDKIEADARPALAGRASPSRA